MVADTRIRLMICDDHRALSEAMATVVGLDPGLQLVAQPFETADAALAAVLEFRPDVILMDVELPDGMNGIAATREITARMPSTKVLVVSGSGDADEMLIEAIGAGAAGFLSKAKATSSILAAVRAVAAGESLLDGDTLARVMRRVSESKAGRNEINQRTSRLTPRERDILQRVSEGQSNEEIAGMLFLSVHTVHTHVRNILMKLEVHSKLQAVALAAKSGILTVRK